MNLAENSLLIGQASVDITPPTDISMSGHGEGFFTGLKDRLYATAIVFAQGKIKVCLITADVIGFNNNFTQEVQTRIAEQTGMKKGNILLCATHTHRCPNIIWPTAANNNISYIEELKARLARLAHEANNTLAKASIGCAAGKAEIGVNRRLPAMSGRGEAFCIKTVSSSVYFKIA